ncbi:odorant receptor 63a-like isoform X1 [Anoplolepis gracilipes]|uniref:odorant receptor 63a-like isoform X1 n=1 Tax=Anoplolepis gracilipes TaxID=354296 RepID=UPI003BA2CA55
MLENILREYNINRIFLSCLGLWPFQHKVAKHSLPWLCCAIELSYLPFEIITLYIHRNNKHLLFESLYQIVVTIGFTVKLLNQFFNHDKFQRLYETMENHWNIFTNDFEVRIMKNYSNISQKFAKSYAISIFVMMSIFITVPSLAPMLLDIVLPLNESRPRQFAIYAEFGIDKNKYFGAIFLYTTIIIMVGMGIIVSVDTMQVACAAHACSLFQVIGQQIEDVSNAHKVDDIGYRANSEYELCEEKIIYRKYILCLKKHQLALEYVNILNDSYKIVGITFLFFIGAVFSLIGIRIVYVLDQLEELIRYLFIIIGVLVQLLIICYSGQKLMDESQNIFHRVYATKWYKFSPRLKSLVIITLYRSIVPCTLSAGNVFPLSMAVFAAVVRAGVSYFTAFLSFKD